jgi:hypothetical protein
VLKSKRLKMVLNENFQSFLVSALCASLLLLGACDPSDEDTQAPVEDDMGVPSNTLPSLPPDALVPDGSGDPSDSVCCDSVPEGSVVPDGSGDPSDPVCCDPSVETCVCGEPEPTPEPVVDEEDGSAEVPVPEDAPDAEATPSE